MDKNSGWSPYGFEDIGRNIIAMVNLSILLETRMLQKIASKQCDVYNYYPIAYIIYYNTINNRLQLFRAMIVSVSFDCIWWSYFVDIFFLVIELYIYGMVLYISGERRKKYYTANHIKFASQKSRSPRDESII